VDEGAAGGVGAIVERALLGVAGAERAGRRSPAGQGRSALLIAQPLRLTAGKLVGEQQPLRPGEQILADQDKFEPGRVGGERAGGDVFEPPMD